MTFCISLTYEVVVKMEVIRLFCHLCMSQSTRIREVVKVIGCLIFVNCRQYISPLIICERMKKKEGDKTCFCRN